MPLNTSLVPTPGTAHRVFPLCPWPALHTSALGRMIQTEAHPADYDRAIASLVAAFTADPCIRWMFPDSKQYFDYFPLVLKYFAGGAFGHSPAYRSDDFKAAALWLPPGFGPDEEALGAVMQQGVTAELQEEVFAILEQVGAGHPEEAHWYLSAIGVEPRSQG